MKICAPPRTAPPLSSSGIREGKKRSAVARRVSSEKAVQGEDAAHLRLLRVVCFSEETIEEPWKDAQASSREILSPAIPMFPNNRTTSAPSPVSLIIRERLPRPRGRFPDSATTLSILSINEYSIRPESHAKRPVAGKLLPCPKRQFYGTLSEIPAPILCPSRAP
jgi:hypothetical protein